MTNYVTTAARALLHRSVSASISVPCLPRSPWVASVVHSRCSWSRAHDRIAVLYASVMLQLFITNIQCSLFILQTKLIPLCDWCWSAVPVIPGIRTQKPTTLTEDRTNTTCSKLIFAFALHRFRDITYCLKIKCLRDGKWLIWTSAKSDWAMTNKVISVLYTITTWYICRIIFGLDLGMFALEIL